MGILQGVHRGAVVMERGAGPGVSQLELTLKSVFPGQWQSNKGPLVTEGRTGTLPSEGVASGATAILSLGLREFRSLFPFLFLSS